MPLFLRSSVANEVFLSRPQHHFNSGPLKRGDLKTWLPAQLDEERDQRDLWRFFLSEDSEDSEESRAFESRFLDLASSGLSLTCCTDFVGKLSECFKFLSRPGLGLDLVSSRPRAPRARPPCPSSYSGSWPRSPHRNPKRGLFPELPKIIPGPPGAWADLGFPEARFRDLAFTASAAFAAAFAASWAFVGCDSCAFAHLATRRAESLGSIGR